MTISLLFSLQVLLLEVSTLKGWRKARSKCTVWSPNASRRIYSRTSGFNEKNGLLDLPHWQTLLWFRSDEILGGNCRSIAPFSSCRRFFLNRLSSQVLRLDNDQSIAIRWIGANHHASYALAQAWKWWKKATSRARSRVSHLMLPYAVEGFSRFLLLGLRDPSVIFFQWIQRQYCVQKSGHITIMQSILMDQTHYITQNILLYRLFNVFVLLKY